MKLGILPRCIRQKDAPNYLGTNERNFNKVFRPHLTEIPLGEFGKARGIGYDREELDTLFDEYKRTFGRPPKIGEKIWVKNEHPDFTNEENTGTSIKRYSESSFANQPKQKILMKPKKFSEGLPKKSKMSKSLEIDREEHLMRLYGSI